jgi:hypothetical protein
VSKIVKVSFDRLETNRDPRFHGPIRYVNQNVKMFGKKGAIKIDGIPDNSEYEEIIRRKVAAGRVQGGKWKVLIFKDHGGMLDAVMLDIPYFCM